VLLVVGIFGTCLFYGDGVITPAISVLSAVEGLEVVSPAFKRYVIPLTLVILFGLFAVQKRGTGWHWQVFRADHRWSGLLAIACLGWSTSQTNPAILWALSPHYALGFIWHNPGTTFIILGAVVLCVTGGEALYADMGHFGKQPIRLAWFAIVMPALTLNDFGQGALLVDTTPAAVKNPFYLMAPDWALMPLVVLATMATVIASQALISGAFSVTKQVIQLGYLPRLQVQHTSVKDTGPDLPALCQLGLVCGHRAGGGAVQVFQQPGRSLRYCGVYRHADHHHAHLLCDPLRLEATRCGTLHCGHRILLRRGLLRSGPPTCSSCLTAAGSRWSSAARMFVLMMTWNDGRRLLNASAARRCDRLARLSGSRVRQPAGARGRHGRVPDG